MKIPRIMYYRRRILLTILERAGNRMEKLRLQKLLFLFTRQQKKPAYHFLPYKTGCYSFQANEDARILSDHYGFLKIDKQYYSLHDRVCETVGALKTEDAVHLENLFEQYGKLSTNELIHRITEQYPGMPSTASS